LAEKVTKAKPKTSEVEVKTPVRLFGLEARYAHALFGAAAKDGVKGVEKVEEDLKDFTTMVQSNANFKAFVFDPTLAKKSKIEALNSIFDKAKFSDTSKSFFAVLAENGRLKKAPKIIDSYASLMAGFRKEVAATITTAEPLSEEDLSQLKSSLTAFVKADETVKLSLKVDSSIIGGLIVNVGDKRVDMSTPIFFFSDAVRSVSSRIAQMKRVLQEPL
jgi:F-type H+-transporting ATPase subunit O